MWSSVFDSTPAVTAFILAALGLSLIFLPKELKVLEEPKYRWLRWMIAGLFFGVGILAFISDKNQRTEEKKTRENLEHQVAKLSDDLNAVQKKLSDSPNATVGMNMLIPLNGVQELVAEKPVKFNIGFLVTTNTAKNLRGYEDILTELGQPSTAQSQKAWTEFMERATPRLLHNGEDRIVGTGSFATLSLTLKKREIDEVLAGKRMIYILGREEWTNLSGSDGHFNTCKMMEPPKMKYLSMLNVAWHDCLF